MAGAAGPSQEEELRALIKRAIQLPSPLSLALDSIPPGTLMLPSQLHNSSIISSSVAFINESLHLVNDLSSFVQILINQSIKELDNESCEAAPVIDEQMKEEAVRNATQLTKGRFEQIGQNQKDKERKEGSTSSKKRKLLSAAPPADGVRGGTGSSSFTSSGRNSRTSTYNSKGVTVHCASEDPDGFDHYKWRKYGEKSIHGTEKRRAYYRCTHKHDTGCLAMKRVQACEAPKQGYSITYVNDHTCGSVSLLNNPLIISSLPHSCDPSYNIPVPNVDHLTMPLAVGRQSFGTFIDKTTSPSLDFLYTKATTTAITHNHNQPMLNSREPIDTHNPLNPIVNCDPLFIDLNNIATNYTSTPTLSTNDNSQTFSQEFESINSSIACPTPSSSQPSLEDPKVSFLVISPDTNAIQQTSLRLHDNLDHQVETTSFMSEAYLFEPPCNNDEIMYFASWPKEINH